MRETRIPMISGDEYDGLTSWKKYCFWKAGQRKHIKNGYRRRMRRKNREIDRQWEAAGRDIFGRRGHE